MKQLTDEELVVNTQAGSHHHFEELVNRYSNRLFHYFRSKISRDEDIEDLVQETFLKVYRNIRRFDDRYKFSTWIYTTASRLAISYFRKMRNRESTTRFVSSASDPHETLIKEDNYKNLWCIAQTLQKNQYQVLWLRYMEDMSTKEIARVMGKSQIYVRVLLHRARLSLTRHMAHLSVSKKVGTVPSAKKAYSFL